MYETMDELMASVQKRLYRLRDLADDMGGVVSKETAEDGSITATVDGNGALVDLEFSQAVSRMSPEVFERTLVQTAHAAARRAFTERAELITAFNEEMAE
ncbi:YbaB/EbfC family nucleoid-associated protein [Nocardia arthritidis]|uniref:YbaB/EbfC family DNA-binding protein n=1 Tax=Nocardia arthritidis TaxID=228602 RepID=A0A6G9Y7B1_9NOCA|nr:YbaB/EbfC family nucleoid-associated protein [Nocardia arthritidis]QIS09000.1 YbaB/EbfC family DNA-binding protein [Nocardia arthritidis]